MYVSKQRQFWRAYTNIIKEILIFRIWHMFPVWFPYKVQIRHRYQTYVCLCFLLRNVFFFFFFLSRATGNQATALYKTGYLSLLVMNRLRQTKSANSIYFVFLFRPLS